MKTLKLLNKKNLSIIIISLLSTFSTIAEDKPVDIWNIDKKEIIIIDKFFLFNNFKVLIWNNFFYFFFWSRKVN